MLTLFSKRSTKDGEVQSEVRTGFIGKIRSRPDFVRFVTGNVEVRHLDQWIHEGIAYLGRRFPADWKERLGSFATLRFYIGGEVSQPALSGIIRASQDKSGRQHPFVSFSAVKDVAPANLVPYVPFYFRAFSEPAEVLDGSDGQPLELDALIAHHSTLAQLVPVFSEAELAGMQRDSWQALDMGAFWSRILADAGESRRAAFVRDVVQTLRMAANRGPKRTGWGIRLPLPQTGEREAYVSFWLSMVYAVFDDVKWRPHIFWSAVGSGLDAAVTIYFREPSASSFAQLICPECDEGGVVDAARRPLDNMPEVTDPNILNVARNASISLTDGLVLWTTVGGKI